MVAAASSATAATSLAESFFPALLFLFVLTVVAYLVYSGLLTAITPATGAPPKGSVVLAYKTGTGPYRNCGSIFTNAVSILPNRETMGIYYDDPEAVPEDELRYAVGSILAEGDDVPVPAEMDKMLEDGFKIIHLPKVLTHTEPVMAYDILNLFLGSSPSSRSWLTSRSGRRCPSSSPSTGCTPS